MVDEAKARARFAELMASDDGQIALDRAALLVAQSEYPWLEEAPYLRRLDEMAAELRLRLSPEESPARRIAELNTYLFGEQAFHGNATDYYDPRNSYLNDVLDRRTGIPITLSLVYLELARRVGLRIEGVGMPGHFIVRCPAADDLLIDPFNQGAVLSLADCAERLREMYGGSLRFSVDLLQTSGPREMVTRILGNLKGAYLRRGDLARALRAVQWARLAQPNRPEDLREQGLLRYRLRDFRGAIADLQAFLEVAGRGPLAEQTRGQLAQIEQLWTRRN